MKNQAGKLVAVGYVRVSTEGQAQEGISLEAQRGKIRAWAEVTGYELLQIHVDAGISGCRSDNRPGLQEALTDACKQKAALVVYSLSRLARSTKDAIMISERLGKSDADLVSLSERIDTTTAAGKMVFRMLAVLAEFERDQVSERTKAALAHLRKQGQRISGMVPYGYTLGMDGSSLRPHDEEQAAIRSIAGLRQDGMSLRDIAGWLAVQGIQTKSGRPWSPKVVRGILLREVV